MKITLDLRKSAIENAQALFNEAKKFKRKAEGARKAIAVTRQKLAFGGTQIKREQQGKARAKKKWFHEYRFFTTTNGFLCAGGKNAKQNDTLVASQLKENDLFFHADVHGASAVILKDGLKAKEQDLREAAQFAACYSNAWKGGSGVADVYCVSKEQVSKHSHGEFVGKGAFLISGERTWFKNVDLHLSILRGKNGELVSVPLDYHLDKVPRYRGAVIRPGSKTKEELFEELKPSLNLKKTEKDEFFVLLPGGSEIV